VTLTSCQAGTPFPLGLAFRLSMESASQGQRLRSALSCPRPGALMLQHLLPLRPIALFAQGPGGRAYGRGLAAFLAYGQSSGVGQLASFFA